MLGGGEKTVIIQLHIKCLMERTWKNQLDDSTTESKLFSTGSFEVSYLSGSEEYSMSMQALKKNACTNPPAVWGVLLSICCHLCHYFGKNCIYQASSLAGIFVRSSRIAHLLLSLDIEFNGMAFGSVPLLLFLKYSDNLLIDSADHYQIIEVFWSIQMAVLSASGRNGGKDETTQR